MERIIMLDEDFYTDEELALFDEDIVTRCKDCQHYMDDGIVTWCRKHLHKANASDYCAWAERKAD